jgi:hypothetical protein
LTYNSTPSPRILLIFFYTQSPSKASLPEEAEIDAPVNSDLLEFLKTQGFSQQQTTRNATDPKDAPATNAAPKVAPQTTSKPADGSARGSSKRPREEDESDQDSPHAVSTKLFHYPDRNLTFLTEIRCNPSQEGSNA